MKNNISRRSLTPFLIAILLLSFIPKEIRPQVSEPTSAEIYLAIKKLNVLGSVLYIAAHPDDENNAVLTYMSKEKLVKTGYLSLTRGDGGQNLLGSEKGDLLGVIRTQELLSARKIDGAEQFFTRAVDFGFSKSPDETLKNWDREKVLSDIVKVIRLFRPDVIITRFSRTAGGHGHHLASAILAEEAFYAAADPNQFKEQLNELSPWQAKRIVWDSFNAGPNAISVDIGLYNSLLGKSYNEIAGLSRTMHKSQGFGVGLGRGSRNVLFDYTAGDSMHSSLFDGVDLSWNRIEIKNDIQAQVNNILGSFDFENPSASIKYLLELYQSIGNIEDNYWTELKKKEIKEIIRMCAGLWIEAVVWQDAASPGDNVDVRSMIVNRSKINMELEKVSFTYSNTDSALNKNLEYNTPFSFKYNLNIPKSADYSQPYWLKEPSNGKMFSVSDVSKIGKAENDPALTANYRINIDGVSLEFKLPVQYRWTDAVEGERYQPFVLLPKISIKSDEKTLVFPNADEKQITVHIEAKEENLQGKLFPVIPVGWKCTPEFYEFELIDAGEIKSFVFGVKPNADAVKGELAFKADISGNEYSDEIVEINYDHIKYQTVLLPAITKLVKLDIKIVPGKIAYIMGSGDEIPTALMQLGFDVDLLNDDELNYKDLSVYDAVITGIRAFNVRENLDRQQKRIIDYVENGGTWVAQHNTRFGIQVSQIGPYPFPVAGRDRVAEENAEVQILLPDHKIFNYPNKISQSDFEGWVQERGVNFADTWGGKLYPLLSTNDTGEPSKLGGLLYARYGDGIFIYTAFSWFRQLPAGVEGAYKLFVNIISAKR